MSLFFAPLLVCAGLGAACGGKVIFDTTGGGGSIASTTTDATTNVSTSIAVGSTTTGGCDATSHTLNVSNFNLTCNVASDCVSAFLGNFCQNCRCPFGAISATDEAKYQMEAAEKSVGAPPDACDCPASTVECDQGVCTGVAP